MKFQASQTIFKSWHLRLRTKRKSGTFLLSIIDVYKMKNIIRKKIWKIIVEHTDLFFVENEVRYHVTRHVTSQIWIFFKIPM